MKRILITGSDGNIGKALSIGIKGYKLTLANLPKTDVRDYAQLEKLAKGQDVLIHLAWNSKTENYLSKKPDADNFLMAKNAYEAAINTGIKRIIMASSVWADNFRKSHRTLLSPYSKPSPTNAYGKTKIKIEQLGQRYSEKGLEVVCVRFGAVDSIGAGNPSGEGAVLWLSQRDLLSLIKKLIDAKTVPHNFVVMYGVSNNKTRVHDYSNPFGWKPKDDSSKK